MLECCRACDVNKAEKLNTRRARPFCTFYLLKCLYTAVVAVLLQRESDCYPYGVVMRYVYSSSSGVSQWYLFAAFFIIQADASDPESDTRLKRARPREV